MDIKELENKFRDLAKIISEEVSTDLKEAFQNWFQRFLEVEEIQNSEKLTLTNEKEVYTMFATTVKKWGRQLEKKGKKEGKIEGKIETAKNMLKDGFSTIQIQKYTGLSMEEIEKLK